MANSPKSPQDSTFIKVRSSQLPHLILIKLKLRKEKQDRSGKQSAELRFKSSPPGK